MKQEIKPQNNPQDINNELKPLLTLKEFWKKSQYSLEKIAELTSISKHKIKNWSREGNKSGPFSHEDIIIWNKVIAQELKKLQNTTAEVENIMNNEAASVVEEPMQAYGATPVGEKIKIYNIDLYGNYQGIISQATPIGSVSIPFLSECDFIYEARNNSMAPLINTGDWLGVKKVKPDNLLFGSTYLLIFQEYSLLRKIYAGNENNTIITKSNEADATPQEFDKTKVLAYLLVKHVLPINTLI